MNKAVKVSEYKNKVAEGLRQLTPRQVKEVFDFMTYLRIKEEWEATQEVLSDKDLLKSIQRAERDVKAGRVKAWEEIREDV